MDRVYVSYNYYSNVLDSVLLGPQLNVHRETVGIEKTFLGGDASIGLRLPILETRTSHLNESGLGDLSVVFKYAPYINCKTGDVLSGGLVVTVPSGRDFQATGAPNTHPVILQPWTGSILTFGDFYMQGFTSYAFPLDDRIDSSDWFNDVGIGYFLYRSPCADSLLAAVIPTLECHYTEAVNHRGVNGFPGGLDIVSLTGGVTLGIGAKSQLNIGVNVPISGPRPYDVEGLIQLNCRF